MKIQEIVQITTVKENFVKPQLDVEWSEANRYPEFRKIGKAAWIELASKGKAVTITDASDIENTDAADPASFKNLDPAKQKRALAQVEKGNVELPIVAVYSDGYKELIGGNTRLTAMMAAHGKGTVWQFEVPDEVAELAENFADDQIDEGARQTIMAFAVVGGLLLGGAIGVKDYKLTQEWMQTYEEIKETDPARADEIKKLVIKYKSYPLKLSGMKELTKQEIENIIANAAPKNVEENFADGKVKGKSRPGRVKRAGASCNGSVTDLRKRAKNASGEKAKMYHWCANMKGGKKK